MKRSHVRVRLVRDNLVVDVDHGRCEQEVKYVRKRLLPYTDLANAPHLTELFEFLLGFYAADRLIERPRDWTRLIDIEFPTARLAHWEPLVPLIERLIGESSGDDVHIRLLRRDQGEVHSDSRNQHFALQHEQATTVALLSDGLDSLCGAVDLLEKTSGQIVFVSVITNSRRRQRIDAVRKALGRRYGARVGKHEVHINLIKPPRRQENTQRGRTLLAISAGLVVCAAYGSKHLVISENGMGILNLPLPSFQARHHASQVLHPSNLRGWARLSEELINGAKIDYINRFKTKAQMCRELPEFARRLIRETSSCDAPSRRDPRPDCGVCGSCLFTKMSLLNADLAHLDKEYMPNPPTPKRFHPLDIMAEHAELLDPAAEAGWNALIDLQPTLESSVSQENEAERMHATHSTIALIKSHVKEVRRFVA